MWGSDCQPAACCCCFSFLPFTGDDTPSELHHPLSSCCFRPALKGRGKKKTFTNIYLYSKLHLDTYKYKETLQYQARRHVREGTNNAWQCRWPQVLCSIRELCSPNPSHHNMFPIHISLHAFCQTIWSNHVQTHTTHTHRPQFAVSESLFTKRKLRSWRVQNRSQFNKRGR